MAQTWKGTFAAFVAGGLVGVFLAPAVAPALSRVARPAAKAAVKSGMALYRRGRESAAELLETIEDITAEVAAGSSAPASAEARQPAEGRTRRAAVH
jgi:hypothetical protein